MLINPSCKSLMKVIYLSHCYASYRNSWYYLFIKRHWNGIFSALGVCPYGSPASEKKNPNHKIHIYTCWYVITVISLQIPTHMNSHSIELWLELF